MTALRGLAAAFSGAAEGMGAGLVAEAKSAREEMMERLRQAHQSEEAEKGRQLTRDEGAAGRDLTKSENAENRRVTQEEGGAGRENARTLSQMQIDATKDEGKLNRAQQASLAATAQQAAIALKKMDHENDATKPANTFTAPDGGVYRPVKDPESGNINMQPITGPDGKPFRRSLGTNQQGVRVGATTGKIYPADHAGKGEGDEEIVTVPASVVSALTKAKTEEKKIEASLAIADKKTGAKLDEAQIKAATTLAVQGMKSEDAALLRAAVSGDKEADRKLKEKGIDVAERIAKAHDEAGQKRTETTAAATVTAAGVSAGPRGAKVDAEAEANIRAQVGSAVRKESRERADKRGKGFGDMTKAEWENAEIEKRVKARIGGEEPAAETPPAADPPKPRRSLVPGGAEAPPAAGLSDGPPTEAPAKPAPKPAAGGDVPRPDKMTDAQIIAAGKASLAQAAGRPDAAAVRAKIEARMRAWGVDPSALGK